MDSTYYGKSLRFWVIVGSGVGALIIIVALMIKYTGYTLAITGEPGYKVEYAKKDQPTKKHALLNFFGLYLVPRSAAYLSVSTDTASTRVAVDERPVFGTVHREVTVAPQRTVSKIGRESLGCTITNATGNYTYKCFEPENIVLLSDLDAGRWHNTPYGLAPADARTTVPYKNGLLSLTVTGGIDPDLAIAIEGSGAEGVFENAKPQITALYTAPGLSEDNWISSSLEFNENDNLVLAADTSGGDGFAVYNTSTGKLQYFENATAPAKDLSRKAAFAANSDTVSCSLNGSTLACYHGTVSNAADGDEEQKARRDAAKARKNATGTIETFNLKDRSSTVSYVRGAGIDSICLTQKDIIGLSKANAVRISTRADKNAAIAVLGDDAKQISCGNLALYGTEKGVYIVSGGTATLAFSTDHLDISTVAAFKDQLLFNAFVAIQKDEVSNNIAHTYRINTDKALSGKRLEDVLPYSSVGDTPIFDMDYNDSMIYIKPAFSVISDKATGETTIDEVSFSIAESKIHTKLENDGVLSVGIPVVYSAD